MSQPWFIVDDANTNSILYQPKDLVFPTTYDNTIAFSGTITEIVTGGTASLTFSGTAVVVYGIATTDFSVAPPSATFKIDGSLQQTSTAPNNGSLSYSYPFFESGELSSGQHTLDIAVTHGTNEYPFILDYIVYLPESGATPTASQQATATAPPGPTVFTSPKAAVPVGAIVGGVVGGIAVLLGAAIAVYLLCFRHRGGRKPYFYATHANADELLAPEAKPTPYENPPSTPGPQTAVITTPGPQSQYSVGTSYVQSIRGAQLSHIPSAYTPSEAPLSDFSAESSTSGPSHPPSLFLVNGHGGPRVTSSPNQPHSKAAEAGLLSVPQPATYHADSGIRFNSPGEGSSSSSRPAEPLAAQDLADVPPTYSES
ncbi:hypothetical protein C8Q78DRAFT_84773 [Trametes maxima]|nr:hypothetical protein C8Q78DRAFT_84773 [Trametes maxima]